MIEIFKNYAFVNDDIEFKLEFTSNQILVSYSFEKKNENVVLLNEQYLRNIFKNLNYKITSNLVKLV